MFDESKHPRDANGKFTAKGGASATPYKDFLESRGYSATEMSEELAKHTVEAVFGKAYIPLDYFGKSPPTPTFDENQVKAECPKEAFGFADRERLYTHHHQRHAKDMGYKDQSAYEVAAINFWKSKSGKLYYDSYGNVYYLYDSKSTKFVAVDKEGIVHTYMLLPPDKMSRKEKQFKLYEIKMSNL